MGRIYTAPFVGVSLTNDADQDIWEFINGSAVVSLIHSFEVTSALTTDERLSLRLVRRSTTGSGGSAATVVKQGGVQDSTATAAVNYLVTTPGTIGNILTGVQWSELAPYTQLYTPEMRVVVPPSGRLCLNLQTAVAATRTISGFVVWEEIG